MVGILAAGSTGGAVVPHVVLVAGASMEPTVRRGAWVRVAALEGPVEVGDVVVLRGRDGSIVHRVLHLARFHSGARVFHGGDASRRFGLAALEDVLGRVVAEVPDDLPVPRLDEVDAVVRRRLRGVQFRCRCYSLARRALEALLPRSG